MLHKTLQDHQPAEGTHSSVRRCGSGMIDIATFCRSKEKKEKKTPNENLMVAVDKTLAAKKKSQHGDN